MLFSQQRETLAVIGAGPKGLAVAVKAKVLSEFGLPAYRVLLIEKNGVAAHWSGEFGYTNGEMILGTPPEKDVVFPIETNTGNAELDRRIHKRLLDFTWMSFLVQTNSFSDWVDRGRPGPCHQRWANYLRWVYDQIAANTPLIAGEVTQLAIHNGTWNIQIQSRTGSMDLICEKLMLTGPGAIKTNFEVEERFLKPPVYDLESFWSATKKRRFARQGSLAIVGAGENAASILLALGTYAPDLKIEIITPKGFISTRSENYYENQVYSQPERNLWQHLDRSDRLDFIRRTDLGVFSVHAMSILNNQRRHGIVPGRLIALKQNKDGITLSLTYGGQVTSRTYDQVILATGFDQVHGLHQMLATETAQLLEQYLGRSFTQEHIAEQIGEDLAVKGLPLKLYMPTLAGLTQGPGFANLSCLGRLSDRILVPAKTGTHDHPPTLQFMEPLHEPSHAVC